MCNVAATDAMATNFDARVVPSICGGSGILVGAVGVNLLLPLSATTARPRPPTPLPLPLCHGGSYSALIFYPHRRSRRHCCCFCRRLRQRGNTGNITSGAAAVHSTLDAQEQPTRQTNDDRCRCGWGVSKFMYLQICPIRATVVARGYESPRALTSKSSSSSSSSHRVNTLFLFLSELRHCRG